MAQATQLELASHQPRLLGLKHLMFALPVQRHFNVPQLIQSQVHLAFEKGLHQKC